MKRLLFNVAAAISVLVSAVAVALWARSYSVTGEIIYEHASRWIWFESRSARVIPPSATWRFTRSDAPGWSEMEIDGFGFHFKRFRRGSALGEAGISFDFPWVAFLLVLITPWPIWVARRRFRKPGNHCCSRCRYDLTGNISGVCPECGKPIVLKPQPVT